MCAHAFEHMWACVSMYTFVLKPEDGITRSSIPMHFSYWGRISLWVWGFQLQPVQPASPLTPAISSVSSTLGLQTPAMRAWLLHGFWEIGAVSQLSEASALLTQHVPSSCLNIWNRILYKPETDTDFVLQHVAELVYRVGVVRCTRVSRKTTQNVL